MILTARALNRTVLARQPLLSRTRIPIGRALERVAGLQAQYAPSPYVRLWSILDGFALTDLTRALERRRAVQGTLMRSTIHIVSPRDYWHFAAGIGPSRQQWWVGAHGREHEGADPRRARRHPGFSAPGTQRSSCTSAVRRSSRAVSPAHLLHEDPAVVRDVPRRRLGRGHLEGRARKEHGDAPPRAVRAAPAGRAR